MGFDDISESITLTIAETGVGADSMSESTTYNAFPYLFPIVWAATGIILVETGAGVDDISETVALSIAETGEGTEAISLEDIAIGIAETGSGADAIISYSLTIAAFKMTTKIIPKDLLTTKIIPKDILATKCIPKDIFTITIKGGG